MGLQEIPAEKSITSDDTLSAESATTYQPRPKAWVYIQKVERGLKARHIDAQTGERHKPNTFKHQTVADDDPDA